MTKLTETDDWVICGPYLCRVDKSVKVPEGEPGLLFMRDFVRRNKRPALPGQPAFTEGFVGFLSYELGAKWQGIASYHESWCHPEPACLPVGKVEGCRHVPEAHFVYVDKVLDFKKMGAAALTTHFLDTGGSRAPAARDRLSLGRAAPPLLSLRSSFGGDHASTPLAAAPKSNLTCTEYFEKLARIKEYLYAGDTYQVNFSQKFEASYDGSALSLFQKLATINPSPHQFFMEMPESAVISNSPERLLSIRDEGSGIGDRFIIETQPIKGTVPRGATLEEDEKNIKQLLASKKDEAELAMIVDLSRNDIGKICRPGTVKVIQNRAIEKYSHVIHTVSKIRGVMEPHYDWYDGLRALFPGGSVTGCPKKRTMEIIEELEQERRGVYCGSAGWIDLSGSCDFNILIRTLFYQKSANPSQSGCLTFRSGGGIVVDSNAQKEYEETLHKAGAILLSI